MIAFLYSMINFIILIITVLVILKVVLSYFLDPYQPIRQWIDRLVEPMLRPIRRIIPPIGMVDLSPIILIILIQIIGRLVLTVLSSVLH